MNIIDTHSHLYTEEFETDIQDVVERAKAVGITRIFLPNINKESISPMLSLCATYPGYLYPMMGLHPEDVTPDFRRDLEEMHNRLLQDNHPYIAIGEIGLDYYWDRTYIKEQQEAFEQQVGWAEDTGLPLMIHCRNAHKDLVNLLGRHKHEHLRGVFHCFSGTADEARELLAFDGFALGIGGTVTFKKSTLPDVLSTIPLERIVMETDAPYLAPVPHRGKRNESAYLRDTLECLAAIYKDTPEHVAAVTSHTAQTIFPLSADRPLTA